jgi:amino-acid N-acetyltransferase
LLSDVFIAPKYRNKGYATLFLQEVLSQVYAPIYAQLLDKELINFYSRFGFVPITDYLIYRPN